MQLLTMGIRVLLITPSSWFKLITVVFVFLSFFFLEKIEFFEIGMIWWFL